MDEKDMVCGFCNLVYNKPKILPCQHTFCKSCLSKQLKKNKIIICPTCSEMLSVPKQDINKLDDDLLMDIFLNENQKMFKSKKSTTCTNCNEKKLATRVCVQCTLLLCSDCFRGHQIIRKHREKHNTFDVARLKNRVNLKEFQQHCYQVCEKHKEPQKLFCNQDKMQLCHMCAFSDKHKGHSVEPLEQEITQTTADLEFEEAKLNDIKTIVTDNQNHIEELITKIKHSKTESLQQIAKQKQIIIQTIEINSKILEDRVKVIAKEGINNLEQKQKKNSNILQSIREKQQKYKALDLIPISSRLDATMLLLKEVQQKISNIKAEKAALKDEHHVMKFTPLAGRDLEYCLSLGKLQFLHQDQEGSIYSEKNSKVQETDSENKTNSSGNHSSPEHAIMDNNHDPRKHLSLKDLGSALQCGDKVVRGPGWNSGVVDGVSGSTGIVDQVKEHFHGCYTITVKWQDSSKASPHSMNVYSAAYELQLA